MTDTFTDEDRMRVLRLKAMAESAAPLDPKRIDQMGAPARVRAAVGNARTPQDRLATLQRYYPDAQPYGEDNFVFTDPETKRPTIYNPEGLDFGDLPSIGPELAEAAGGMMGAAGAVVGTPFTGGASMASAPILAGGGAAAGREMYDLAAKAMLGTTDTRSLPTRLADTGATFGVNAIGQRFGEMIPEGFKRIVGNFAGSRSNPVGVPAVQDFDAIGVTPSAGAVTGNPAMQTIEKGLHNTTGGSAIIQGQAERQVSELETALDRVVKRFGPSGTGQEAGETLKAGAKGAGERFATRRNSLDDALEKVIGADTPVQVGNVAALRAELQAALAAAPESRKGAFSQALAKLDAIGEDAGHGLTFKTLRQIRTDIGRDLERPDISGYSPSSEAAMRRVYGALSEDIKAAAKAAGPDAEKALAVHDRYVRFNRNVNLPVVQKVADQATDEAAYRYAMSGSKEGGSRLFALRRNVTPEEWDVVASSTLSKMGRAKPGAQGATELDQPASDFSVNTFLTNWNNLAPEARQALFSGTRYAGIRPELDALVRVTDRLKETGKLANPSGTARHLILALGAGSATNDLMEGDVSGAAGTLATAVLAPRYAAKLITSPTFVRWLSNATTQAAKNPDGVAPLIGRLAAIAEAEPELAEAIHGYADALRASPRIDGQQQKLADGGLVRETDKRGGLGDAVYSRIKEPVRLTNEALSYLVGPHMSDALARLTGLLTVLSPVGGGQDALEGSREASEGVRGGDVAGALRGIGDAGLGLIGMIPAMGAMTKAAKGGIEVMGAAGGVAPKAGKAMAALPMDEASRMARAKDMGFRTEMPLYHGHVDDISAFDPSRAGSTSGSQAARQGVSVALEPATADEFAEIAAAQASDSYPSTMKLLHRAERPAVIRLEGGEKNLEVAATLNHAFHDLGHDAVLIRNYTTPSGATGRTVLFVKDPNQLRSTQATFDPSKKTSGDLLAGITGLIIGGSASSALSDSEAKP